MLGHAARAAEPVVTTTESPRAPSTYSAGLKLLTACLKRHENPGHSTRFLPSASRYQLTQLPAVHTVPSVARCRRSLKRSCASWRASTTSAPCSRMMRRQSMT